MRDIKQRDLTLLSQYREQLRRHPKLKYLFFELTDCCNLSCLHCGSNCTPGNGTFLPFELIRDVLDRTANAYTPSEIMVCLSGGEPMLHPDFFEIAAYARSLGFFCGVTTNATMIDETAAKRFGASGIQSVAVSLDGLEQTHNWLRKSETAYQRAICGIGHLIRNNHGQYTTQVTSVISKQNIHELPEMFSVMIQLQVDSWRVINMEPIGRAQQHPELLLSGAQMQKLLEFIQEKRFSNEISMEVTYGCSHYLTLPMERMVRSHYFLCGSGIFVASILSNGDIYSCMDIERRPELVQGNAYHDDFPFVWEHKFREFRTDRSERCDECRNCDERLFCGGDSAHTWDYDKNAPRLCVKMLMKL